MARSMEQVLAEVQKQSDPQRQSILKQVSDIPSLQQADESGLEAQKNKGFEDIMLGARRRGVAYWGAPIAEQQDYLSTSYLPSLAKMKQGYNDKRTSLEMALADIGKSDYSTAYNMYNTDRAFEEQQRQFNESQAEARRQAAASSAQQASANSYLAALAGGSAQQVPQASQKVSLSQAGKPTYTNKGSSFSFFDSIGRPITAAQYAKQANVPLTQIIERMAQAGDKTAQSVASLRSNMAGTGVNAYNLNPLQLKQWNYLLGGA